MGLKEEIIKYTPYNEQEEADKELMLNYLDTFQNCLSRENQYGHFTASGFVVNSTRDKVLFAYHNIYDSWSWLGGHADGEEDLLQVALREVEEESGIRDMKLAINGIFSIEILPVLAHIKRGKFVPAHVHLNLTYLIEADDAQEIHNKPDENKAVKWLPIDQVKEYSTEKYMLPVYDKIIEKMRK